MQEPHINQDQRFGKPKAMRFSGITSDYFSIWLSNLILTIVTLGIYSAWAKVRRLQYFYNHTYLDEYAFGYHADGLQILKGRLIVVGSFFILNIAATFFPTIYIFLIIILFFAIPHLINLSLEFNAKVTSYRNLRFQFSGDYWEAFLTFQIMPLLAFITLGFLAPVAIKKGFDYVYNGLSFGGKKVSVELTYRAFYRVYFIVVLSPLICLFLIAGWLASAEASIVLGIIALYFMFFLVYVVYRICCLNIVFNHLTLADKITFSSSISSPYLLWIVFSNLIAIVITLGLAIPWSQVRKSRYLCDNIHTQTSPDFTDFIGAEQKAQSSIGEEFANFEGIELGL